MSTVGVDAVRDLDRRLADAGVLLVDAPVTGGVARATSGELILLVGGTPEAVGAVEPVLAAMGKIARCGDRVGDGQGGEDGQPTALLGAPGGGRGRRWARPRVARTGPADGARRDPGAGRHPRSCCLIAARADACGYRAPDAQRHRHLRQGLWPGAGCCRGRGRQRPACRHCGAGLHWTPRSAAGGAAMTEGDRPLPRSSRDRESPNGWSALLDRLARLVGDGPPNRRSRPA